MTFCLKLTLRGLGFWGSGFKGCRFKGCSCRFKGSLELESGVKSSALGPVGNHAGCAALYRSAVRKFVPKCQD